MDTSTSVRARLPAPSRVARLFLKRLRGRPTLIAVLLVALIIGVALASIRSGATVGTVIGSESTDDAYIRADLIEVSSHIAGYVETVPVRDNEVVRQGQVIATIQDDDYQAKVAGAAAAVAAAQAVVDALTRQVVLQSFKVTAAWAEVRAADAVLIQARLEHARQQGLVGDGTTSRRELEAATADENRLRASREQLAAEAVAAKEMLQVIRAQVLQAKQAVRMKQAALDLARIDLGYTRIVSPVAGQLSERASLPGEYVTPGTRIGLVVPLPHVWVVATFREAQLAHMYPGQSAVVRVDSVPDRRFRGTVDSFEPASGALQALLPPDNATGNFTKIAQRFGVKVILAPDQPDLNRLRPGMSAVVTVAVGKVRRRSGAR